jgi:hypothetical protein
MTDPQELPLKNRKIFKPAIGLGPARSYRLGSCGVNPTRNRFLDHHKGGQGSDALSRRLGKHIFMRQLLRPKN